MRAVSPVIPEADEPEQVYAEDHTVYLPLPTISVNDGEVVLTRWLLSSEERELVAKQGFFYLAIITNQRKIQPVKLTAVVPEEFQNYQPVDEEWPTEVDG